jgi:rhodanese-related sulfurtransferase
VKALAVRCVVVAVTIFGCSVGVLAAPELYIAEETYDFGVAVEGDAISFTFLLENRGDELLVIEDVGSSCGCATPDLSEREIKPGRTARLGGSFDTSGYGGTRTSKNVYVSSNDPDRPDVTLHITGDVVEATARFVEAQDLSGDLMILIDVREPEQYIAGHLPGAMNLPEASADIWLDVLPTDVRIVLCDDDGEAATALAERMLPLGFMRVEVLLGGLVEWTRRYGDRMLVTFPLVLGPTLAN